MCLALLVILLLLECFSGLEFLVSGLGYLISEGPFFFSVLDFRVDDLYYDGPNSNFFSYPLLCNFA